MLHARRRSPAALDVKGRVLYAGLMRAKIAEDVHHSFLSVFLAEGRRPFVLGVETRPTCAGVI